MKHCVYLDIETTGLSANSSDLTVVGLFIEQTKNSQFIQLIGDKISPKSIKSLLKNVDTIYTYNGSRFDLPFIESKLGINLTKHCEHKDLMYTCWQHNLYGGLKSVEQQLKIKRKLPNVDGYIAVQLWDRYKKYRDEKALLTLLDYNKEDVMNLKILRRMLKV